MRPQVQFVVNWGSEVFINSSGHFQNMLKLGEHYRRSGDGRDRSLNSSEEAVPYVLVAAVVFWCYVF